MKLLYTKRSPYARKVRVVAIEKNIELDLIDEDLARKSPLLLASNPLGKVPTLLLDNSESIYDSVVICQYLEEIKPNPEFIPKLGKARVDVLKWEAMADDMVTTAIYAYMEKIRHPQGYHEAFIANSEQSILKGYAFIEEHLNDLKEFNLASVAVACAIGYVHFRLPHLKVYGNLQSWFNEINQRPSMLKTIPVA